jgi:hypothetical protein
VGAETSANDGVEDATEPAAKGVSDAFGEVHATFTLADPVAIVTAVPGVASGGGPTPEAIGAYTPADVGA